MLIVASLLVKFNSKLVSKFIPSIYKSEVRDAIFIISLFLVTPLTTMIPISLYKLITKGN